MPDDGHHHIHLDLDSKRLIRLLIRLYASPRHRARHLALELPTLIRNGTIMPNVELLNNDVLTIVIQAKNSDGIVVPYPAGDTFTAASSDPASLNAVIGANASGQATVTVNALVPLASNVTVTVSDSAGLTPVPQVFDIVADVKAVALALDIADATHAPQAVPA